MGLERRDRIRWLCEHHNWQQVDGDAYDRQAVAYREWNLGMTGVFT